MTPIKQFTISIEDHFRKLLDDHSAGLKQFANSFVKNEEVAEEIVMDVFMRLWEKRDQLNRIRNLKTYLFVAVRNGSFNYLKRNQTKPTEPLETADIQIRRFEPNPEFSMISKEMVESLNAAIESLPPKCKMVFKLLRDEGVSRKNTAKILGISVNTVDNQLAIAISKIGDKLGMDLSDKKNISHIRFILFTL